MPSYAITGAARGIGFEFVNQLSADSRNTVFALVRSKATANKLTELGRRNIHIIEADITDNDALESAAKEVSSSTGGSLDFLINNAAFVESKRDGLTLDFYGPEDLLTKDLLDSFKVNVVGVIHTINYFLPLLKKGTAKKVVTLTSGLADIEVTMNAHFAACAPYSISKAAVNMVNAKYAAQFEEFVFLALSPGLVNTSTKDLFGNDWEIQRTLPQFRGPITPEASVRMQLEVINGTTLKDTGKFISHKRNKEKEWL
ncbi:hypothetical protein EV702DRAFT_1047992 [Suillus placidus]|uniref:NAD(P)-binding protein n=1 Tax=Suillus placidus TaxID=48579 RepID=A0A9P7CZJ0_9AGAM|nr:hypothetical protein EV702DRAFT_1047992 [Suillus placidus]